MYQEEQREWSKRLYRNAVFKGGSSPPPTTTTTVEQPPPKLNFNDLRVGFDPEAFDAFSQTFQRAEDTFLAETEPERGKFQNIVDQLMPAVGNVGQALKGELSASSNPLVAQATQQNLMQQDNQIQNIEKMLSAGNAGASFFGERLKSDAKTQFGIARSNIIPDMINQILKTQGPIAEKAAAGQLTALGTRTGIISDAASFAAGFNAPSRVQTQNLAELARSSKGGITTSTSSGGGGGGKGGGFGSAVGQIGGAAAAAYISDSRVKKDIKPIKNALDKINKITGVTWKWRPEIMGAHHANSTSGVIAQDVQKVLPNAVQKVNKYLKVNYTEVVGLAIEAIKELEDRVKVLEKA
jgi:hypothetical protein